MAPRSSKQWVIASESKDFDGLVFQDAQLTKIGEDEVLVKIRGASLNYRDLMIPKGLYTFKSVPNVIAGSDGAGEVIEVGSRVTQWKKGDRVVTLFNQGHQHGDVDLQSVQTGLGGALHGTLRQYAVFPETGLVRAPQNLNFREAATLTCAGLTSWNALYGLKPLKPGQTVLVQGTGGVSIFALQFAKAAGARVIATTSSDVKAARLKELGAHHVINYKTDSNWGETAKKLTPGGAGVDYVIEVGGEGTMEQSLSAIKFGGIISIIGMLGGFKPKPNMLEALNHICIVRGIYVGSRAQMQDMVNAIEVNGIRPVVDDKVFQLGEVRQAYDYMWAQSHFGKVTIDIE